MSIKDLKKRNIEKNACKTTKAQRRKRLDKFKDTAHKCFGKTSVTGWGDGKPLICDICKKKVYKIKVAIIKGFMYSICDNCSEPEIK